MNEQWPADKVPGAKPEEPRPFRFEDLEGKPEPKEWGPIYPALPGLDKWRKLDRSRELTDSETCAYGVAVGAAIRALNKPAGHRPLSLASTEFNAAKHRAKIRAEFAATAERDNRAWRMGLGIEGAYKAAMIAKRAREASEAAAEIPVFHARALHDNGAEIIANNAEAMTRALAASRDAQAPTNLVVKGICQLQGLRGTYRMLTRDEMLKACADRRLKSSPAIQSPYDQALEFKQRIDDGETMATIATPALIRNRLQLLKLIPEAIEDVRDGRLSATAAYGVSLAPQAAQLAILDAIRSKKLHDVEAIKRAGREARKAA
jgi:hypothetical protein